MNATKHLSGYFQTLTRSRSATMVALAVAGVLLASALSLLRSFDVLELKSLDFRYRISASAAKADTSVVLVAIDQNSLDFYADQQVSWPWPREFYGLLVDYLRRGGARVIAFDIDFSRRDLDRLETDAVESDKAFADAIARANNVILGVHLSRQEEVGFMGNRVEPRLLLHEVLPPSATVFNRATAPLPEFQRGAARLGVINFESDKDDIARRAPLLYDYDSTAIPYFGLACYAEAEHLAGARLDSIIRSIPAGNDGRFLFYWYGRGGPDGAFRYYSIHALILSALKIKAGLKPDVPPEMFRDKNVIIGGSAAGLYDYKPTPFTALEPYPGMEIHATMLSNLLRHHFVRQTTAPAGFLLALALSLLAAWMFLRSKNVSLAVLAVVLLGAAYIAVTVLVFNWTLFLLPVVGPVLGVVSTFALSAVVSYATEGRRRRSMRRAFNRYLNPQVVTEILTHADEVELGGKLLEGTVYFSDIKNFTTIAEKLPPKELVYHLNAYFSLVSDIILRKNAMLDKYIGDAVMAIFGAPIPQNDHAATACLTALEIQRILTETYRTGKLNAGHPAFETRIGLNTGKMVVGNIGSTNRLDYTAIGDTVNLASRLEGVNKVFGTHILVSESTWSEAKLAVEGREIDLLRVKGKQIPIRIYEILGESGTLPPKKRSVVDLFAEGLEEYRRRQFGPAEKIFRRVLRLDPSDGPSRAYVERCRLLARQRIPRTWDGVFTLTSK